MCTIVGVYSQPLVTVLTVATARRAPPWRAVAASPSPCTADGSPTSILACLSGSPCAQTKVSEQASSGWVDPWYDGRMRDGCGMGGWEDAERSNVWAGWADARMGRRVRRRVGGQTCAITRFSIACSASRHASFRPASAAAAAHSLGTCAMPVRASSARATTCCRTDANSARCRRSASRSETQSVRAAAAALSSRARRCRSSVA